MKIVQVIFYHLFLAVALKMILAVCIHDSNDLLAILCHEAKSVGDRNPALRGKMSTELLMSTVYKSLAKTIMSPF